MKYVVKRVPLVLWIEETNCPEYGHMTRSSCFLNLVVDHRSTLSEDIIRSMLEI